MIDLNTVIPTKESKTLQLKSHILFKLRFIHFKFIHANKGLTFSYF